MAKTSKTVSLNEFEMGKLRYLADGSEPHEITFLGLTPEGMK